MKEESVAGPRLVPWVPLVAGLIALPLSCLLDRWVYQHWTREKIYDNDWAELLRCAGYVPTWAIGSLAILLHDRGLEPRPRRFWLRGLLLTAVPGISGLLAGGLKLLIRRERPNFHDGAYYFRPFDVHPLSGAYLGLPSSHAMVAFAAAVIASSLFPRTCIAWWIFAVGCGVTRVLSGHHFLSDVVAGAFLGAFVGHALWLASRRWLQPAP